MSGSGQESALVSKKSVYQSRVLADFSKNRINRKTAAGLRGVTLNLPETIHEDNPSGRGAFFFLISIEGIEMTYLKRLCYTQLMNGIPLNKLSLLAGFLTLGSSGCSSTYLQIPIQRFSTSEVSGVDTLNFNEISAAFRRADALEFSAGSDSARTIQTKYLEATDTVTGSKSKNAGIDFPLSLGGGVLKRFDYQFLLSALFTPQELEVKYQLLGEPRSKSGAGNFSLSLSALIGAGPIKLNVHTDGDTNPVNWTSSENLLSEGLIAGYRINQQFLIYSGIFLNQSWFSVTRDEANAPGLGHVTSSYSDRDSSTTLNLGIEAMPWVSEDRTGLFIRSELAWSYFSLGQSISVRNPLLFGLQVGSRF